MEHITATQLKAEKRTLWLEYIPMDEIVMADVQFTRIKDC